MADRLKLYTAVRNSAGERVRIALNLKGLDWDFVSVPDMDKAEYSKVNPQGLMPALAVDGRIIGQSGAILDYVERRWPSPALLPDDPFAGSGLWSVCRRRDARGDRQPGRALSGN